MTSQDLDNNCKMSTLYSISRQYKGSLIPAHATDESIDAWKTFKFRKDDVLLLGYNKSGTHWMNEVIHLIFRDGDPTNMDHTQRRDCLELTEVSDFSTRNGRKSNIEIVETDPSPRVLKTHLRPYFLPDETWTKKVPVVYVLRNPKDIVISMFDFMKHFKDELGQQIEENFDYLLQDFIFGNVPYGGWCQHVTSYEALHGKVDNILFVTYEDMKKDLPSVIRSVAKHIGHDVTDDVVNKVVENTTMETMRKNYAKAMESRKQESPSSEPTPLHAFLSKGIAGRWKTECKEDTWELLDKIFKEKVKDTVYARRYFECE